MHSRDTTVLIDYYDLMLCTTPACFTTFVDLIHSLLQLKITKIFVQLFLTLQLVNPCILYQKKEMEPSIPLYL